MRSFNNKIVWITGASSGIGAGLARAFAREGAKLILSGRNVSALESMARDCRSLGADDVMLLAFEADAFDQLDSVVMQAEGWHGRIDVLVNNAGISQRSLVQDTGLEVYRKIMDIDFFSPVDLTLRVLPGMRSRGEGLIVVTTSVAGKVGSKLRSGYSAAKHALHGFYDSLRAEVFSQGVEVALLVPGYVKTNVTVNAITADGGQQGVRETEHDNSISADDVGLITVRKLKAGHSEILIASGLPLVATYLKRFFPRMLVKILNSQKA